MGEQLEIYKRGELTIYHLILRYKRISPFFLHWGMFNQLIEFKKISVGLISGNEVISCVIRHWKKKQSLIRRQMKTMKHYKVSTDLKKINSLTFLSCRSHDSMDTAIKFSISFTMNMEVNLVSWWKIENSTLFLVYEKWVLHNTEN